MDADPRFKNAQLYGLNGQGQWGIDAIGDRLDVGKGVQSSKCYFEATPAKIKEWSNDFLNEFESRWKAEGVKNFILSVAATNAADTKLIAQFEAEKARFALLGIEYEWWGPEQLTSRLGDCPKITRRFLDDVWTNILCGPVDVPATGGINAVVIEELHRTQQTLSSHVNARVQHAVCLLEEGDLPGAEAIVSEVGGSHTWSQLTPDLQARILRVSARVSITRQDWDGASELLQAARTIQPDEPRLEAILASNREGSEAGIAALGVPTTLKGRQLLAALLLDSDDGQRGRDMIDGLVAEVPDDSENFRLLAHAKLALCRWSEALAAIECAVELNPKRLENVRSLAICQYANVLSPTVDTSKVLFPNPVEWDFVKTGPAAVQLLDASLENWEFLAKKEATAKAAQVWKLSCLANHPDRQREAAEMCRLALADDPGHLMSIYWVLTREYDVDLAPAEEHMRGLVVTGTADINDVRCCASLVFALHGDAAALEAIEPYLGTMQADAQTEGEKWVARFKGNHVDEHDESDIILSDEDVNSALAAGASSNYAEVQNHLDQFMGRARLIPRGLAYAGMIANRGWWQVLVPYVDKIKDYQTPIALELAAHVLFHGGRTEELSQFLKDNQDQFPGGKLPIQLRRLEVVLSANGGNLPEAVRLANALATETSSRDDLIQLAQLRLKSGNVQACVALLKPLMRDGHLSVEQCVEFSAAVELEDRKFAQQLMRAAIKAGVPDSHLLNAITQLYRLGLDDEAVPLLIRLNQRAAAGANDAWLVNIEEVAEHIRAHRESSDNVVELLQHGAIPIHLVPPHLIISLADLYHLDSDASKTGVQRPLFIRHGARPVELNLEIPWTDLQIHIDVTALFLASELDLIEVMEAKSQPIIISRHLPVVLVNIERNLTSRQQSRVDVAKAILASFDTPSLRLTSTDFTDGLSVRHLEERVETGLSGPTIDTVIDVLIAHGLAERSELQDPVDPGAVGQTPGSSANSTLPTIGQRLVFEGNTLETLASRGFLSPTLANFQCEITEEAKDYLKAFFEGADAGAQSAGRIRDLRDRIATGIETGKYVFAVTSSPNTIAEEDDPSEGNLIRSELGDLLLVRSVVNGVLWTDDRYLSGFPTAGANHIVGVVEILQILLRDGVIDRNEFRKKLLKLRENGAVFIPLESDELLNPLLRAPIRDGRIVETPELRILRRNVSTCLRLDPYLKIGETPYDSLKERPDEMQVLVSMRHTVLDCIASVWSDAATTTETCKARADYIYSSFRMEHCIRPLPVNDPGQGNKLFAAFGVSSLLAASQRITLGTAGESLDRQREFLRWAVSVSLGPKEGYGEDEYLDLVAANLKILEASAASVKSDDEQTNRLLMYMQAKRLQMLPESLLTRMLVDRDFSKAVGVKQTQTITVEGKAFVPEQFWRAVVRALRKRTARLNDIDGKPVSFTSNGNSIQADYSRRTLVDSSFETLKQEGALARTKLRTFLAKLDLEKSDRDAAVQGFAKANTPFEQSEIMVAARKFSIVEHYRQVHGILNDGENFDADILLPPSSKRLLHHMRLAPSGHPFDDRVRNAWRTLAGEFGEAEGLRRLGGLPVGLLPNITVGGEVLSDPESLMPSPMIWLHLAAVATRDGADKKAEKYLSELFGSLEKEFPLFCAILQWTYAAYRRDEHWLSLPANDRLALTWCHANYLTSLFLQSRRDLSAATKWFDLHRSDKPIEAFIAIDAEVEEDCASPDTITGSVLLYHGLAYVFDDVDPLTRLSEETVTVLNGAFYVEVDGGQRLTGALVSRTVTNGNILESFLASRPSGSLQPDANQRDRREVWIIDAIEALEREYAIPEAWAMVSILERLNLDESHVQRIVAILKKVEFADHFSNKGWPLAAGMATRVAGRINAYDPDELFSKLYKASSVAASEFPGMVSLSTTEQGSEVATRSQALNGLMEVVFAGALHSDVSKAIEQLGHLTTAVVLGWPASAQSARELFDGFVRKSIPQRDVNFWKTFVWLRGCP